MEAKLKALEEELDELRREVAICQLCGLICSKQGHAAKYREVMQSKSKQADYFRRLGKRERQTSIRSFITKESRRNEGGFDRPELVQQTISFQVTQTSMVASQRSNSSSEFSEYNRIARAQYMEQLARDEAVRKRVVKAAATRA
jgi:hypothetical protein